MTDTIKAELAKLETECAQLRSEYDKIRADWEKGQVLIAPVEEKMRGLESLMDQVKPRLFELEAKLVHLRKAAA